MNTPLDCWAIIPATGIGQRMQADRPKQYLKLGDKSILEHTLDKLLSHHAIKGVVLVLNAEDKHWSNLHYQHDKPVLICKGGEQRHNSVQNGLHHLKNTIDKDSFVLIHDAVRPFVQHSDIDLLLECIQSGDDGAILAAPVSDTLKYSESNHNIQSTRSREGLWRAFTPQAFKLSVITTALDKVISQGLEITDDASAMELAGYQPLLVDSDSRNIKITNVKDMLLAELLLKSGV